MAHNKRLPVEAVPAEIVPSGALPEAGKPGQQRPETVWVVSDDSQAVAADLPQMYGPPVSEVCAALGSTLDAGTSLAFACAGNRCLVSGTAEPVDLDHQSRYCLGPGRQVCPRLLGMQARQLAALWDTAEEAGEQPEPVQADGWRARLSEWVGRLKARLRLVEETAGWYPAIETEFSNDLEDSIDRPTDALNQR